MKESNTTIGNIDRMASKGGPGVISFILLLCGAMMIMSSVSVAGTPAEPVNSASTKKAVDVQYPALVDVGAKQCIPCKMMEPVLEELRNEYAGILRVQFIDVQVDPRTATQLGVRGIPTQIFYDAAGKERYRHLGYISKEGILKTFRKLGIELAKTTPGKNTK